MASLTSTISLHVFFHHVPSEENKECVLKQESASECKQEKLSTWEEILPEKETSEILSVTSSSIILKESKLKDFARSWCVDRKTSMS